VIDGLTGKCREIHAGSPFSNIDCDSNGSNGSKAAILPLTAFDTQPYPTSAGNDPATSRLEKVENYDDR
jgi:hypothetical protein